MIWIIILLALIPFSADAKENASVVINEIAWMGSSVDGVNENQHWRYEWLELYNTKDVSLSLDGWNIELHREDELYFTIPLFGTILSNEYFLVAASDKILNYDVNYKSLGGKFVNSGMKVVIKDSARNVIDEIDAKDGWPKGDNETKRTMEYAICLQGSDPCINWQTSDAPGGTPKAENSTGLREQRDKVSFENKKDLKRFSQDSFHIFNKTTLLALLLSLLSSALILALRHYLAPRA